MDDDDQPTNIFKFGALDGGKKEDDAIPQNDYVVVDIHENEYEVNGFLIFTPHHLAIMSDFGTGPVPALVLPIGNVKVAVLAAVLDENEIPF